MGPRPLERKRSASTSLNSPNRPPVVAHPKELQVLTLGAEGVLPRE